MLSAGTAKAIARQPKEAGGARRIISMNRTIDTTGYSRTEINRRITRTRQHIAESGAPKEGDFPLPVKMGERKIGFVEAEIDAYIAARIDKRDATVAPTAAAA